MKEYRIWASCLLAAALVGFGLTQLGGPDVAEASREESAASVQRFGMVIGIKPDQIEAYKKLHADDYPGVRDLLSKVHMQNFSIFLQELDDGKTYLFGYYEYVGDDFAADMKWLSAQPRNEEWLNVTDAMQIPLKGADGWKVMEEVYHND